MVVLGAIFGALLGAVAVNAGFTGPVFGALVGALAGRIWELRKQLAALQRQTGGLDERLGHIEARLAPEQQAEPELPTPAATAALPVETPVTEEPAPTPAAPSSAEGAEPAESAWPEPAPAATTVSELVERLTAYARNFLTQGNPIVRVGMVVLLCGIAFLLKYAADRKALPIELRLLGVASGGLGMLGLGWWLRRHNRIYALVMQGGAVGVLYLTIFAAARLYGVVPMGMALALMVAVVTLSGTLAVLQDGRALAVFGSAGGFLAPILTSTGGGSHVGLFAYYALLNMGIAGIAWFRAWRGLNLVGFGFTFVIGITWGYQYYKPTYFASTEPFLIFFLLLFVGIAVLFAFRQPPRLKGLVDGTLVFGVPVVGFGLQVALVHEFEYGMALSAVALGAFYLGLATVLWRCAGLRLLCEAFLALGVVFVTLAVPLALDTPWTTAAWALEGAGLVWVGVRQRRLLARAGGAVLQLLAGVSHGIDGDYQYQALWRAHGVASWAYGPLPALLASYLGTLLVSCGSLFSGWWLQRCRRGSRSWEQLVSLALLAWGLWWWLRDGVSEIDRLLQGRAELCAVWLFLALTAGAAGRLAAWLGWPALGYAALLVLPAFALSGLLELVGGAAHVLVAWGVVPWGILFVVMYDLLYRYERRWPPRLVAVTHLATAWTALALATVEAGWLGHEVWHVQTAWQTLLWVLPGLLAALALLWLTRLDVWPFSAYGAAYREGVAAPLAGLVALWALWVCRQPAEPVWWSYVPLLNPLELAQVTAVLVGVSTARALRRFGTRYLAVPSVGLIVSTAGSVSFVLLNTIVGRTVHHWGDVAYRFGALYRSAAFQSASSVCWTVLALVVMVSGTRRRQRPLWIAGAVLLGAVISKLFLVDLVDVGSLARIVSFLVVGGLTLVIGYFSPLPPRQGVARDT
jgi:uncharacterized membrane protein